MKQPTLTQDFLKSILDYDPETGIFTWKHRKDMEAPWNAKYPGKIAGSDVSFRSDNVYRMIDVLDFPFRAHRLAWLWMTGEWPKGFVDHIDKDSLNNKWNNLRLATNSENLYNRGATKKNSTGFKGVSKYRKGFRATIRAEGKWYQLGIFDTPEEAHTAYAEAAQRLHGKFWRVR